VDRFNLLCLPDLWRLDKNVGAEVVGEAAKFCESHLAFLLVDVPSEVDSVEKAQEWVRSLGEKASPNAAAYFPALMIGDPQRPGAVRKIAPCGALAGAYAATDARRGVWKAPAGVDSPIRGAQGVSVIVTDSQNGILNPCGINVLRTFPVYGIVPWGARTLHGDDERGSEWKYIPVRRLALHIESSLTRGLSWVEHEPSGEMLWSQIRLSVGAFMQELFRQGAFAGTTPVQAYFVRCDGKNNSSELHDTGICKVVVGFAPLKPDEFISLTIQQITASASA
jgi:uncharacterized protein